ncbi:MAG: RHS repeat-associated core domain-containing protein, partial [Cyanobacteria bacterium J06649_11]
MGNFRLFFSDWNKDSKIQIDGVNFKLLQEEQYYPFGLAHEGPFYPQQPVVNPYQYNGKEWNEEFGLGWLDFGHRWYDAAIGRFTGVDPIAEEFAHLSPF